MSPNPRFAYHADTGGPAQQSSNGAAPILVSADRTCFLKEATYLVCLDTPDRNNMTRRL